MAAKSYLVQSGDRPTPWEQAKQNAKASSVEDVPFPVVLDRWLRRYPGMSPADVLTMDWELFLELEAVQRGAAVARADARRRAETASVHQKQNFSAW